MSELDVFDGRGGRGERGEGRVSGMNEAFQSQDQKRKLKGYVRCEERVNPLLHL